MRASDDVAERIVDSALAVAAERGWQHLSLVEVARHAELPLIDVYGAVPTKAQLLGLFVAMTDRAVLGDGPADRTDSPRDRLFDVVMRRFDALQRRRAGMLAIMRGLRSDPLSLLRLSPAVAASLGWMLEAAGIPAGGLVGSMRINALGLVYANALRVWLDDDTADMARTMAAVDRGLGRLEQAARLFPARTRHDEFMAPLPSGDRPAPGGATL